MAFTRNDGLATLTGLLPIPLAALATVSVARTLGARRDWALLAGLVLVATPALIILAGTSYVDPLAVADLAAMWAFGLAALTAPCGSRRSALLVLTGVGVGLAVGVKTSNILPALALVVVVALDAARRRRPRSRIGWFRDAASIWVPTVLLGGYWYVKDLVVFGNPVWPFTIGPFKGVGTFAQLIVQTPASLVGESPIRQILASWFGDLSTRSYPFDTRIGGFGLAWPVIAILAIGGGLLLARSRRIAPLLAVYVPAVVTLAVMPMGWWPRLTLFVVVAALALAAVVLTRLDRRPGLVVGFLIALLAIRSLGVASATANTTARASGSGPVTLIGLIKVIRADDKTRAHLGLWAECRGFDQLPDGAIVATDGFNLLHLVVGHNLTRRLTPPIEPTADPARLLAEARAFGATYLAILMSGASEAAVRADPTSFRSLGAVCRDVEIVALAGP
jgi:Dolichyl-phosphate-mannose-protein mannosyltransferase